MIQDEGARPAGPAAAGDPPPPAEQEGVPPTTSPTGEAVEKDLDALLEESQKERDEYLELARRTKADFENFRKRVSADLQAAGTRGKTELARELIDPVDNLERAIETKGIDVDRNDPMGQQLEDPGQDLDGFEQGVLFVFLGLRETLARHGVETLNPMSEQFDPQWHEALSTKPVEGIESGTVVEVMQKGYKLGEQLIRPARVVVSA